VLDKIAFLKNGVDYLACALELRADWISTDLTSMRCSPTAKGLRPHCLGLGDSLWRSAKEYLFPTHDRDETRKEQVMDFLTFAFQHILMLGRTARELATITFSGPKAMRAMVSLPTRYRAEELLLAVAAPLSGPENTFIKRLWLLERGGERPNVCLNRGPFSSGLIPSNCC
jgi:hypothetical protein